MAWYDQFLTTEWDNRFQGYAKKMFSFNKDMVQEAYGYANEEFFSWAKTVNEADTNKQTTSQCITVYKRKLIDFHRHHFKKFCPHKWVEDKGEPWPETAKLLAYGYSLEDIHTELQETLGIDFPIPELRNIMEQLFQRPYGQYIAPDQEEGDFAKGRSKPSNQEIIDQERHCFVRFLLNGPSANSELPITVVNKWQSLSEKLELTDNDRLMLRLRYYEDMSYTEIADLLDTKEHSVRRRIKGILEEIKELFRRQGIRLDDL